MKHNSKPAIWLWISVVYVILTFVLSSLSYSTKLLYQYRAIRPDLILHFIEYAILAVLLMKYLAVAGWLKRSRLSWWFPIIIGGVVGGANELLQFYIPYRFPSISDALANLVGAGIPVIWTRFQYSPSQIGREEIN